MRPELLDILRCPFCGGRLGLAEDERLVRSGGEIVYGILGCHCCAFPVVDGIPIIHLEPSSHAAREHLDAGRPDLARRAMFALSDDRAAERVDALAASADATYREIVDTFGAGFEGGYFLYRFSDPTYVVASAVVRGVAGRVLAGGGRAVDLCGGSGHLTRLLLDLSSPPPVLTDLYYSKVWLAQRFTAPGCDAVCCDANAPLPFERGAFRFAVCSDAYHYVWTKRLFASEMLRVIETPDGRSAAVVSHTHNANHWNPSAGMPLPPEAYRDLFADLPHRLYGDSALLASVLGGTVDLSREPAAGDVAGEGALTLVASRDSRVFSSYPVEQPSIATGEFRVNPLYATERTAEGIALTLRFPSADYEEEYAACRRYLPERVVADAAALAQLPSRTLPPALAELARRRVVIDLPRRYC